jgi:SAM-dependent methyltransferase
MSTFTRILASIRWRELRVGCWRCACCRWPIQLRLVAADHGVRCGRCGASAITQSLVAVLRREVSLATVTTCLELSGRGKLVSWLARHTGQLTRTEYMPSEAPGITREGVRNEDVQAMTFADASFDLCTCTEVFEHVHDDRAGFAEVQRVLRPGGAFAFTVPLTGAAHTLERARLDSGRLVHLLEPEYHHDPYTDSDRVLCMRNYGRDITARLREAGFASAAILAPAQQMFGYARGVMFAVKGDQ